MLASTHKLKLRWWQFSPLEVFSLILCLGLASAVGIFISESGLKISALAANAALWLGTICGFIAKREYGIAEGLIGGILVALMLLVAIVLSSIFLCSTF